uniref:Uncharacterized protein n=1 Tax=Vespula pensylvanica TaxID=30213 RepID=A0A834P331_VESPE|nr:hypothetical protein H0235_008282 [Vespula pensylvanica]
MVRFKRREDSCVECCANNSEQIEKTRRLQQAKFGWWLMVFWRDEEKGGMKENDRGGDEGDEGRKKGGRSW